MKPRKILFVITKATSGGAQKYLYDLVTHLPEEQFEPVVAYGVHGRLADDVREAGIELRRLPSLGRDIALISDLNSFFQLIACIRVVRPDAVHLNSSKAAGIGALAARICGVRTIVFTVHGWPFKERRAVFTTALIYFFSWLSALMSTHVVVVSKVDEDLGKRMLFCGGKIIYIPLAIEPLPLLPRNEALMAVNPSPSGHATWPHVVTIAELTHNKGQSVALRAIAQLKDDGVDVQYTMIGDGEDAAYLAKLASELEIAGRVRFARFIPGASRYLNAFDIFLLPSIKEGMPYVLLEAAAAGLPIVTTNVVDPAFLGNYEDVTAVGPSNPRALAAALLEVIRRKKERPLFAGRQNGSFEKMLTQTEQLYRN